MITERNLSIHQIVFINMPIGCRSDQDIFDYKRSDINFIYAHYHRVVFRTGYYKQWFLTYCHEIKKLNRSERVFNVFASLHAKTDHF